MRPISDAKVVFFTFVFMWQTELPQPLLLHSQITVEKAAAAAAKQAHFCHTNRKKNKVLAS